MARVQPAIEIATEREDERVLPGRPPTTPCHLRRILVPVAVQGVAVLAVWMRSGRAPTSDATRYRTASVVCGDLQITVSATGTAEPEEVVDVGAQVIASAMAS